MGQEGGKWDRDGAVGVPASASKLPAPTGLHEADHLGANKKPNQRKRAVKYQ